MTETDRPDFSATIRLAGTTATTGTVETPST